jgi:hypothetical protein
LEELDERYIGEVPKSFRGWLKRPEVEEPATGPTGRPRRNQRSWIKLTNGPTVVDQNGEVIDPYGVTVYGYFAFERIADDVPKEYRPAPETLQHRATHN